MTEESGVVCAYVLEEIPIAYVGEVSFDKDKLIFKNTVIRTLPTDPNKPEIRYVKPQCAGKGSSVHINTTVIKGVLVKDIDHDDLDEYKRALLQLYSSIHLV